MSGRKFKAQASSSRATSNAFGGGSFGAFSSAISSQKTASSSLSYITEPPDLSQISDPQVVVAFKNLLKRDSTTKARALEELLEYVIGSGDSQLEDGFLEAWTSIYPRTSIETSRRVRQLAHTLHGQIVTTAGKRIARYVSPTIGVWLAGLYESDNLVRKAAQDSLVTAFPTPEKQQGIWVAFQSAILEFAIDAILQQSPETLSDERTVRPDDAEAKYVRVVATALQEFTRLLAKVPADKREQNSHLVQQLFESRALWKFSYHADPFVRQSVYALLLWICSGDEKEATYIDWKVISTCVLSKSLSISQLGSASNYSSLLVHLTKKYPNLWTTDYSAKAPPNKQLLKYIASGSDMANSVYWENLFQLITLIPSEALNIQVQDEEAALQAIFTLADTFHKAIGNRDEPRANTGAAWNCYLQICLWLPSFIPQDKNREEFFQRQLFPILDHFIKDDRELEPSWVINDPSAVQLCTLCFLRAIRILGVQAGHELWIRLSDIIRDGVLVSEPEQSPRYRVSQDSIAAQAHRFFQLGSNILPKIHLESPDMYLAIAPAFTEATVALVETSIQVLKSRNGKPYGASAVIDEALAKMSRFLTQMEALETFIRESLPDLILSPSGDRLLSILLACRDRNFFQLSLEKVVDTYYTAVKNGAQVPALKKLLSSVTNTDLQTNKNLMALIMVQLEQSLQGNQLAWMNIATAANNSKLKASIIEPVFGVIVEKLEDEGSQLEALKGMQLLLTKTDEAFRLYVAGENGSKLLSKLLYLSESPADDVALLAESLQTALKTISDGDGSLKPIIQVLEKNFTCVGDDSLSVESLVAVANDCIQRAASSNENPHLLDNLLPNQDQWEAALATFLDTPPNGSISVMSPLGGAACLLAESKRGPAWHSTSVTDEPLAFPSPVDQNHRTLAFRLAFYVTSILDIADKASIPIPSPETIFLYLPLVTQLIDDELSIPGITNIIESNIAEPRQAAANLVADARNAINQWIRASYSTEISEPSEDGDFVPFWEEYMTKTGGNDPRVYRCTEAFVRIISERASLGPIPLAEQHLRSAISNSGPSNPFALVAAIAGYSDWIIGTPTAAKLCNQYVADITSTNDFAEIRDLQKLVILNVLAKIEGNPMSNIPTQRIVFLVKHLIGTLKAEHSELDFGAEALKLLASVLPQIREVYGSHWSDVFDILKSIWDVHDLSDTYLPTLHSSLRLFECLRKLAASDSNEDLEEILKESQPSNINHLVNLLSLFPHTYRTGQPGNITADLLARQISTLDVEKVETIDKLLEGLHSLSLGIQRASFSVLQRVIPSQQVEVSFELALSKTVPELPTGLLGLLLVPPPLDRPIDEALCFEVRSYLLGWKTFFNYLASSSISVREGYISEIKEAQCLNILLDFTFDQLELSQGKLVDASKFPIRSFELAEAESQEKEIQWGLIHNYYLSLRYLPNLTRSWWVDCKKRVKTPVETWTQKHISPLVIEDTLDSAREWHSGVDWSTEEQPLEIKILPKTAEIIGSIEIDDESPPTSIAISLPQAYPLHQATVIGRSRVAVDEKKWKAWLLAIQGVILFSNGNLIDGLLAFRKNVQGALKGQGECPICVSIISTNMQTPNKRCATCKNTFHSDCLFKWFKSSNSSSCPLCRNSFLYS
ncbi:hypothetical protein FQN57_006487 [Myotisia sp. PD_48]|nr:hypothetical protein FQN57_006487 [Myotisia sp. PD_48]